MRIAFVGTAYPMRGGIAQFNALLYRALQKNHEVLMLSFKRQYPSVFFPGKTQFVEGLVPDALKIPSERLVDSIGPATWFAAARRASEFGAEVLLFKYWMPFFAPCFGTISRLLKRRRRASTVLVCDNVIPHERRPFDGMLTRYMLAAADGFVVMSESVRDDLLRFKPDACYEMVRHPIYDVFGQPLGKQEARRRLGLPESRRLILFFGYVREYKGLDVLLEAMGLLKTRLPELLLLVAGEFYEGEARYRKMVSDLGIEDRVVFRSDYVPDSEVGVIFSAADAVVLPYRSATQSGIVQVAFQIGTPVICTDVGGLAEVVPDGKAGLIVRPGDPAAVAAAIGRFYEEDLEETLRAGVAREREKYSWRPLVEAIERLASVRAQT